MKPIEQKPIREKLQADVRRRWEGRRAPRDELWKRIERDGPVGAASPEAARGRLLHMTYADGRTFERVVGRNDTDQVNFLDRGARAARAVCRILQGREPAGTGFLVAPGLLLTNAHVIATRDEALEASAEFDFQLDADDRRLASRTFRLDPAIFVGSPDHALDFTLVGVAAADRDGTLLSSFGWLPLDAKTDKILEGEPIVIVQHPDGLEKRLCLFDSELRDRAGEFLHYTTDTEPGASGSPAFNRHWQVVALHHASVETGERRRGAPVVLNEGVRVSRIVDALKDPAGLSAATGLERARALLGEAAAGSGRPPAQAEIAATPAVGPERSRTRIRERAAEHLDGRRGYDPRFLSRDEKRLWVPLPELPPWMADDATPLGASAGDHVLRYMHYSVVMCRSRKLAFYSAANVDGATLDRSIGRLDRDPDRDPEGVVLERAADVWFYDPRIPKALQLAAEVYDETAFAFGHLTRRLDPVWGSDLREKRIANDDTFHMTNCTPQHQSFNSGSWQALENTLLAFAENRGGRARRVTVITGPVLDPRDPDVLGVPCPTAYWKVAAWADGDALRSAGFIQWQADLVDEIRRSLEGAVPRRPEEEWIAVRELGRLTGLGFGPLVEADVRAGTGRVHERLTEAGLHRIFG